MIKDQPKPGFKIGREQSVQHRLRIRFHQIKIRGLLSRFLRNRKQSFRDRAVTGQILHIGIMDKYLPYFGIQISIQEAFP
jgi:hypothetical protein